MNSKRIEKITTCSSLIIAVSLYFIWGSKEALGFLLGTIVSLISYRQIIKFVTIITEKKASSGFSSAFVNFIFRYLLYIAALAIGLIFPEKINIITIFFGVMPLKIVLIIFKE